MKIEKVKEIISEIENYNYDNFTNDDYHYILKKMGELMKGNLNLIIPKYDVGNQNIFRCRSNKGDTRFTNARNLWHPPKEKTITGRLNFEKKPILYTAHNASTAMCEIDSYNSDFITTVEYKVKASKLKLIEFGISSISENEREQMDERNKLIMKFLSREAKKNVTKNRSFEYCPTIIFATSISQNKCFDAFMYESVATNHNGINFAFKSKFAEENLVPVEFRFQRVYNKKSKHNFMVECLAKTNNSFYDLDTELNWVTVNDCKGHNINSNNFSYH